MNILDSLRTIDFDQFEYQENVQVTRDLVELILEQLDGGELDLEYLLHGLVLSIMGLETKNMELRHDLINAQGDYIDIRTQILNLESRLLDAGVRLERNPFI